MISLISQIDSTPYFERDSSSSFIIPSFNNAKVTFLPSSTSSTKTSSSTILKIESITPNDYGILCAKLYESQCSYTTTIQNNYNLRQIVKNHFSKQKPHTGYDASVFKSDQVLSNLCNGIISSHTIDTNHDTNNNSHKINNILQTLIIKGYVTIDTPNNNNNNNLQITSQSYIKLSQFLQSKTKQDNTIRSDTVAFLDLDDGIQCGLENQFRFLLGIANFLNEYFLMNSSGWDEIIKSEYDPLLPGTKKRPLTNPRNIQAAEYGYGEYYVAHR